MASIEAAEKKERHSPRVGERLILPPDNTGEQGRQENSRRNTRSNTERDTRRNTGRYTRNDESGRPLKTKKTNDQGQYQRLRSKGTIQKRSVKGQERRQKGQRSHRMRSLPGDWGKLSRKLGCMLMSGLGPGPKGRQKGSLVGRLGQTIHVLYDLVDHKSG